MRLIGALLVTATVAAYANSLHGAFVFDDLPSILENDTLRSWSTAWCPPSGHGVTVSGRPLLNASLALNHAIGGDNPVGYHVVNLLIHALAGLVLFGVIRRTLLLPSLASRFRDHALPLAAAISAVWLLHPLQTEAVTYIVQRAESLCGLFYLLGIYSFVRAHTSPPARRSVWLWLSLLSGVAGAGTKEVICTLPVTIFVYDCLFLSRSWREPLKTRRAYYAVFLALWILLAGAMVLTAGRADTAGFATGIDAFTYLRTSTFAVVHYARLSLWPTPLIFDYGRPIFAHWSAVWPELLVLIAIGITTVIGLLRRHPLAFLGVWYFLILAPSSSFVPIATQTMAEHRAYLPSAALIATAVLALFRWLGPRGLILVALAAVGCAFTTAQRNTDYATAEQLWRDTLTKAPGNARAHLNYGALLFSAGRHPEALEQFATAVRLDPQSSDAHNNLANALKFAGRPEEALLELAAAVRLGPDNPLAHWNYGAALAQRGKNEEAEPHYATAVALGAAAPARVEWAQILTSLRRTNEAEAVLRAVPRTSAAFAASQIELGNLLLKQGRLAEAERALRDATLAAPSAEAFNRLGYFLLLQQHYPAAVQELSRAVALAPAKALYHANYAVALARSGELDLARSEVRETLRLDPRQPLALALDRELGPPPAKP